MVLDSHVLNTFHLFFPTSSFCSIASTFLLDKYTNKTSFCRAGAALPLFGSSVDGTWSCPQRRRRVPSTKVYPPIIGVQWAPALIVPSRPGTMLRIYHH